MNLGSRFRAAVFRVRGADLDAAKQNLRSPLLNRVTEIRVV
jgi:hypothetical protein